MGQDRFAREMAGRIDSGEFDDSPVAVFRAAQAMEHLLTNWTWLDEAFPAPVTDFVFGWSSSSAENIEQIRAAAHDLVTDQSSDGPPLPPAES